MYEVLVARLVIIGDVEEERRRGVEYSTNRHAFAARTMGMPFSRGDHRTYLLEQGPDGNWCCDCQSYHRLRSVEDCRHVIAAQAILRQAVRGQEAGPAPQRAKVPDDRSRRIIRKGEGSE